jgi:hypothetical protein
MATPIAFICYADQDGAAAHRLHMDFMLHNANARLLQAFIPDAAQRQQVLLSSIATADLLLVLHSAHAAESEVWREQIDLAKREGKPIYVYTMDEAPLATMLEGAAQTSLSASTWEADVAALFAWLGITPEQFSESLPHYADWVADRWRVKFYNFTTNAFGYGDFTFEEDGAASGTINIAQGRISAQTKITGSWALEDNRLTVSGKQVVRPTNIPIPYQLEVVIEQIGERSFRARTPQGDGSVFQRFPTA